ncbi:RNA polymerase sigma factor (sigma-70 family) [Catalinimonas alkaloidigena]|uniref:RNA polymerase sigma factor n=1 Tax=Catalinimonas alkaloidigena TaxID=1075417 RepID=UPI0024053717|nr:sigma-70 family RNA polymerase sigma factor [Catalinimonas alkaloidigena]MDF9795462.1 RNA polymerase sigma factor (sigma-70 family) [Catalinimonas alkaloidigena]
MTTKSKPASEYDDSSLYQGLLKNDQSAFEYLYTQNFPAVRQLIFQYRGSEDDAKDIFQEGVIALWNNIRSGTYQLREGVKLSTYLIQICKLRWMDKMKKASSRYEVKQEVYMEPAEEAEVMVEWIDKEEQSQFQQQFAQLGERCQNLLKRFYFLKQSLQEIAEVMTIGEASAKNEKYRCMQRLKKIVLTQS